MWKYSLYFSLYTFWNVILLYCHRGWSMYYFIILAWEFCNKLSIRWYYFSKTHPHVFHRVSRTVYVVAQEVLQSTHVEGVRCVFAMRSRNVGSFLDFLIELSHNLSQSFCEVVRSDLEDSDFLPLDSDTSCAREWRGWFYERAPIPIPIGDETSVNSFEIPCERTA